MDKYDTFIDYILNIYEELPRGDLQGMVEAKVMTIDKDKTAKEQMQIANTILEKIDSIIYELDRDLTKDWTR